MLTAPSLSGGQNPPVDSVLQMVFGRLGTIKLTVLRAQEELWDRLLHYTVSNHR